MALKDPEARARYQAEYRAKNAEALSTAKREWYLANRELCLARAARRYEADPSAVVARSRQWVAENPEKARASSRKSSRKAAGIAQATAEDRYGECPLCRNVRQLVCDHDHATGEIRGWICNACNMRIGSGRADIPAVERSWCKAKAARREVWQRRLEYLKRFYGISE